MNIRSAKSKGRRAVLDVINLLHKYCQKLERGDILATSASVNGEDILLSAAVKKVYPFAIEVKNQESIQIWAAYQQATTHAKPGDIPILFFKRNKSNIMACLEAEAFLSLLERCRKGEFNETQNAENK